MQPAGTDRQTGEIRCELAAKGSATSQERGPPAVRPIHPRPLQNQTLWRRGSGEPSREMQGDDRGRQRGCGGDRGLPEGGCHPGSGDQFSGEGLGAGSAG